MSAGTLYPKQDNHFDYKIWFKKWLYVVLMFLINALEKIDKFCMKYRYYGLLMCLIVLFAIVMFLIFYFCGAAVESGNYYNHLTDII